MAETWGLSWFDVGNAAWIATVAAGSGWLGAAVLRRRHLPAAHAVTVAATVILFLAPLLGWLGSRWSGLVLVPQTTAEATPRDDRPPSQKLVDPGQILPRANWHPPPFPQDDPVAKTVPASSPFTWSWLDLVLAFWALGSLFAAVRLIGKMIAARKLRRSLVEVADPAATLALQQAAQALGVTPPRLAASPLVCAPVVLGPRHPVIILPVVFRQQISGEALASVLRHELGHLVGRHHAAALAQNGAAALWWWHPLVWRLGRVQADVQEEIADNFALATLDNRQEYVALLLRWAEATVTARRLRVGLAMQPRRSGFARRIESLLQKERVLMTQLSRASRWRIGGMALASVLLMACLTVRPAPAASVAVQQQQEDSPPAQKSGQGQKSAGGFKVESFEKGKAIPVGKAQIRQEPGKPPVIVYPASRSSSTWIEIPGRVQVAIGEGIEWQGKTAYLSLTFELVVADTKTGKALWADNVGAFWNTITFENVAKPNDPAQWAVVLKSSSKPEFQQNYDLETGRKLELKGGAGMPAGTSLTSRKVWSGSAGVRAEKLYRLVGTAEEWTALRKELFGDQPKDIPQATDIDFSKESLLVCYMGRASNCRGIRPEIVVEDDNRLLLRLFRSTYQSIGRLPDEYPYGLIVLPRRPDKPHVLEYNTQRLIGGPPIWKEFTRVSLAKAE